MKDGIKCICLIYFWLKRIGECLFENIVGPLKFFDIWYENMLGKFWIFCIYAHGGYILILIYTKQKVIHAWQTYCHLKLSHLQHKKRRVKKLMNHIL